MKNLFTKSLKQITLGLSFSLLGFSVSAQQTSVYDVISGSPNHSFLTQAIDGEGLDVTLDDQSNEFTIFAPDDDAFEALADSLGFPDVATMLANPPLPIEDILEYHILDTEVGSGAISNGDIVTPLNTANTLKLTKTSANDVFVNHAEVNAPDSGADNGVVHSLNAVVLPAETVADVAIDNGFSILVDALVAAELLPAVTNPFDTLTVFAPSDAAFNDAFGELGITAGDLLNDPNLADILLYHVLGAEVASGDINNGDIVTPLNAANTIKLTKTVSGDVYANQALVELTQGVDNGIVHAIDAVIFSDETVADVAIDNGFTILVDALVAAELLPAVTNPFDTLTVFAPSDAAFNDALGELGITAGDLLNDPNLADILLYHVLGDEVASGDIDNGDIVTPLNAANTIKLTKTVSGDVYANQAMVEMADFGADNGVVHAIDAVILTDETVVDAAIDNDFNLLVASAIYAELVPALSNPFDSLTVFAPTDAAFSTFLTDLGVGLNDLDRATVADILLYHVVDGTVLSGDLTDGDVTTLLGEDVTVDVSSGASVLINNSNVITADVEVDNGVVHAIDAVLEPELLNTNEIEVEQLTVYPNPTQNLVNVSGMENATFNVIDVTGAIVHEGEVNGSSIQLENLENGTYIINLTKDNTVYKARVIKQ